MASHSCSPYRGYAIDVDVSPDTSGTLGGDVAGYALRWRVLSAGVPNDEMVSFAEQWVFITEFDAIAYGEGRARAFVDHMVALHAPGKDPVDRRVKKEQTFKA